MLYSNTPTPEFRIANPLARVIEEGESIIAQLNEVSAQLEASIADRDAWHSRCKEALDNYEMAETDALSEAIIMAQAKEGPLANIAVSSKAFDIAMSKLKNDLRRGYLAQQWQSAERVRRSYEMAQVELQQTETRFNALRKVAELKTQILRASTI